MRKFQIAVVALLASLFLISCTFISLYFWSEHERNELRISNLTLYQQYLEENRENKQLRDELDYYKLRLEPPPPTIIGEISAEELTRFLEDKIEIGIEARAYLMSERYRLISVEDLEEFLALDTTDAIPYHWDFFDCDDYAIRVWGMASADPVWASICFGIGWDGEHVFNLFVTKENEELVLYKIEAQEDKVEKVDKLLIRKGGVMF